MATGSSSRVTSVPTTKGWTHREVGQVFTDIEIENAYDVAVAARGFMDAEDVRAVALTSVLVDTGATHLSLPAEIIARLGLGVLREIQVETATGEFVMRVFEGARVTVAGRTDTFSCIELPEGRQPLLGVVVMESLGLRPDLQNHRLDLLPEDETGTHFMAMGHLP